MREREQGKGQLSSLLWLGVFGLAIYVGIQVVPAFIANYNFVDKVTQACRIPMGTNTDESVIDMIMKDAEATGVSSFVSRQTCKVHTQQHRRTIDCSYDRELNFVIFKKMWRFEVKADQPLIF
jgi:hypothetical protein